MRKEELQQDKEKQGKMSAACLQLTEATLAFPSIHGGVTEEITLWGPGTGAWMNDSDAYHKILAAATEAGMDWENGPFRAAVLANIAEMKEMEEIDTAYEQWCQEDANMDDLHEASLFTEYNQATGTSNFIGADQLSKNMKIPKFTPEMLAQRDDLNRMFNFRWNDPQTIWSMCYVSQIPDQTELLEITATGDNHGVAKCAFGAVFVPKGVLKYLQWEGGHSVGTLFDAEITFTPGNKFPWRVKKNGVTFTYQDMQGTRYDEY